MLLRRTTATAVARVYSNFLHRFDTPGSLARSRLTTIEKLVTTLGLQKLRAKHLKETARILVSDFNGEVPSNFHELSALPGVGRYVASAVLNFAFGRQVPLVDGNVVHLISRVFDIEFKGPSDDEAWKFMESFGNNAQHSVFYWSIIDLVAAVCIRSSPRCSVCPLKQICSWTKKREEQDGIT
jgi:A/G-specific adenine glycosylase